MIIGNGADRRKETDMETDSHVKERRNCGQLLSEPGRALQGEKEGTVGEGDVMNSFIVSFRSTTAAMQFSSIASAEKIEGRIIPVPRSMSAGCGMAWLSPAAEKSRIVEILKNREILFDSTLDADYKTRWTHEERVRTVH